ncbi:gamma-glutamyltransferase [Arenicella chitinivorans]|nr:gamma-glutamyltransferase [Arenicella chitinivorans]
MNHTSRLISLCVCLLFLAACSTVPHRADSGVAAYAMPDKYAARVVEQVLSDGGNAVDAAVAAAFVLAVTFPEAGNIGGGGFMLIHDDQQNYFLDYRERAPQAAHRDMYLNANGDVDGRKSLVGILAAGVPGTVDGLWRAHQRFGTQPWRGLVMPAVELAKNGFDVHPKKAKAVQETVEWFNGEVNFAAHFGAMAQGGVFKQPELAAVLQRIADQGPDDFYRGKTAELFLAHSEQAGGLFTAVDLSSYESVWRTPLEADWRDYRVITAPPPSSGGFAVIQLLKMKAFHDQAFAGVAHNSSQYVHLIAEMEKRVFADRAQYFGDPDYVSVPIKKLISDEYIQRRAAEVQLAEISHLESVKPGLESPNTTHFSILDKWGNAVSNTYTLNWSYGSGDVVEGTGILLNNEMDDFSVKPGVANVYGVIGGTANEIQPGKRMLSSMSPTILLSDGEVDMVVGTPGGSTIFTSVFQAITNVVDNGMTAQQAVSAARFHHQLLPPELVTMSIQFPLPDATIKALSERGYRLEPHGWEFGDLQMIKRRGMTYEAASDARGIGVSGVIE